MCEQSQVYNDGDIVWVKLSNCWWPAEVHGDDRLPADMVSAFKKKRPFAIVKFFQEDSYEYVKNINNIHSYCSARRLDFIRKGLDLYQANNKYMEMFPADVATAERRTKGDPDIINNPAALNPTKQTSSTKRWAEIVSEGGASNSTNNRKGQAASASPAQAAKRPVVGSSPKVTSSPAPTTGRPNKEHEVRILGSSTSRSPAVGASGSASASFTPQQLYKCHLCNFSSGRMNLLILHSKSHSTSSADGTLDSRRNSLTNRSTTSSTMTPTKRFSTTSSGSTCSPALSPVSSPPPPPPSVQQQQSQTASGNNRTPAGNKSRPPKKRTKRLSSSTEERSSPTPPPPSPKTTTVFVTNTGSSKNSSSKPTTSSSTTTRRSRHRRRSASPPPQTLASTEEQERTLPVEKEKSPTVVVVVAAAGPTTKNIKLQHSLLMDWSDDDEGEEEKKKRKEAEANNSKGTSPVKVDSAIAVATAALVSPGKSTSPTDTSGRSSPIRCRNIPKKDRRDFIFEEFEPKVTPNRTEVAAAVSPVKEEHAEVDKVEKVDVLEQTEEAPPIVQKKKKAAIERLSQQAAQEDLVTQSPVKVAVREEEEQETEIIKGVEAVPSPSPSPAAAAEPESNNNHQMGRSSVTEPVPSAVSCFDFDDEASPACPAVSAEDNGEEKPELAAEKKKEEEKDDKIKQEIEKKDLELLAQIGNILHSTSEFVEKQTLTTATTTTTTDNHSPRADPESVSPLKAKLSDLSLPPKERGKRIFKSRNSNLANSKIVSEEEVVQLTGGVKEEEKTTVVAKQPEENNRLPESSVQEDSNALKEKPAVVPETGTEDPSAEKTKRSSVDPKVVPTVPRKRRFDKEIFDETNAPVTAIVDVVLPATDDDDHSPLKKMRRVSSPDPIEQALKEVCEDKQETTTTKQEAMEVDVEKPLEENDVATKPKINSSNDAEGEHVATSNGGGGQSGEHTEHPCPAVESSPIKTNDLLCTKTVQKVQIVQRVRGQDGVETTETKVAKISSADSGTVVAVAITQVAATNTAAVPEDEQLAIVSESEEKTSSSNAVNGQAHQESLVPATDLSASDTGSADPQILAIPAETFDGPANSFYLCTVDDGNFIPIDNQPLYLDASNQLVPTPPTMQAVVIMDDGEEVEEVEAEELVLEGDEDEEETLPHIVIGHDDHVVDLTDTEARYILTTGTGQQILLDLQSLLTIASGGEAPRLVCDGQEMVIEGSAQEILSSITLSTSSDLEYEEQSSGHDIIGTALTDTSVVYPSVSTAYVSETNAVLTQPPIMSTLEVPSKADACATEGASTPTNLDERLAVIGVRKETNKSIPASLELPITITNPKIVAKTTQASIKSVYMTTAAVCGSKMETATAEYWTEKAAEENETGVESNGHDEEDDQIVMEEDDGATEEGEEQAEVETAIILSEATEFAT